MMNIPQRLLEVIRQESERLSISSYDITKLQGDASSRVYYRIQSPKKNFVAMVLPENQPTSLAEEVTKVSGEITELPFISIQKFFKSSVPVPEIHAYDEKKGVLLLEDFGDDLLLYSAEKADLKTQESLYKTSLDELAKICELGKKPNKCIAFQRSFDRDLYNWEFLHFVEYAIDKPLAGKVTPGDREDILKSLYDITAKYLTWDQLISHRDYHSRNLMVLKGDKPAIGIIDFQDALVAPVFYDLASLLRDSYIALDPTLQDNLVEYYRQKIAHLELCNGKSRDEFRYAFDLMGLHRNMKAAGRFFYIDIVKKNPSYLKDVPRTLGYIRQTLEMHGKELSKLKGKLEPLLDAIAEKAR